MPYINFDIASHARQHYIPVNEYMALIKAGTLLSFSKKAARDRMRTLVGSVLSKREKFFDKNFRFPPNQIYVDLNNGSLAAEIDNLCKCLDLRYRNDDYASTRIAASQKEDSSTLFYNTIGRLSAMVHPSQLHTDDSALITRESFESKYKWE